MNKSKKKNNTKVNKIIYIVIASLNIIMSIVELLFFKIVNPYQINSMCDEIKVLSYISLLLITLLIVISIINGIKSIKAKRIGSILVLIVIIVLSIFSFSSFQGGMLNSWACVTIDKPIIYIYPTEDNTNISINLSESNLITHSYPKYEKEWDVIVSKEGNIYDPKTNRNYYGLYWEGIDNTKINTKEGFIIKGEDTISFLEEKLEILGLNEREANEFIVYWLPKLENNKYNFIRFRTIDEINDYMKINTNVKVDTLIRIYMDYKPLNKPYDIKEQALKKQTRKGFTIVEWGGRELK